MHWSFRLLFSKLALKGSENDTPARKSCMTQKIELPTLKLIKYIAKISKENLWELNSSHCSYDVLRANSAVYGRGINETLFFSLPYQLTVLINPARFTH